MSDIHQEWRELRKKNGDFLCHLDGEMAKLEKEKNQMIFYDPITCTYFKADHDEIQEQINKLREELVSNITSAKKMSDAYTQLLNEKADLQKKLDAVEKQANDISDLYGEACMEAHQAKVAKDRIGYSNRCMQSKIAKQANEIKRLTEENKSLRRTCGDISLEYADLEKQFRTSKEENKQLHKALDASLSFAEIKRLTEENELLHKALDIAAKDADANFERGKIKGMGEIWAALQWVQDKCEAGFQLMPFYGYYSMADCVNGLTATAFLRKTVEWQEKEARDIKLGDEVEIFDQYDHSLSDNGIVIAMDKDEPCFAVIGPQFEACFTKTDIDAGNVKKTGRHFDTIPLDYLA